MKHYEHQTFRFNCHTLVEVEVETEAGIIIRKNHNHNHNHAQSWPKLKLGSSPLFELSAKVHHTTIHGSSKSFQAFLTQSWPKLKLRSSPLFELSVRVHQTANRGPSLNCLTFLIQPHNWSNAASLSLNYYLKMALRVFVKMKINNKRLQIYKHVTTLSRECKQQQGGISPLY